MYIEKQQSVFEVEKKVQSPLDVGGQSDQMRCGNVMHQFTEVATVATASTSMTKSVTTTNIPKNGIRR